VAFGFKRDRFKYGHMKAKSSKQNNNIHIDFKRKKCRFKIYARQFQISPYLLDFA
jgi:hypothetical protein